jgi:voltage-gated potassium channel
MKKKVKKRAPKHEVDVFDNPSNRYFVLANTVLALMTLVSVAAIALETVISLDDKYHLIFKGIEWTAVILFSLEYIARIFTNKKPLRYIFSFFGIVDLVAILPSFLGFSNLTFLKSVRTVRIIRLLRMLRLAKFSRSRNKEKTAKSLQKINLEIYFLSLTLAVLVLGSMFYTFEHHQAASIPDGMYWALKSILGGFAYPQPVTFGGTITLILARFTSMILLGMMLSLVGTMLRKLLIGSEKD